jgi:hypothetical protein
MSINVKETLGSEAGSLLDHACSTIAREHLHLPGPDFVDRVWMMSDRPTPVLRSLQQIFDHGRLGGTGYLSILPVDQGIEHSAGASFRAQPGVLRSGEDRAARHRGRLQRRRLHAGRARRGRAPVRAPDPVPREAEPQRAAVLSEPVRPGLLRPGRAGIRDGRGRGRRDDLLRRRRVAASDPGDEHCVRARARAGHGDRPLVLSAQFRLQAGQGLSRERGPHRPGEPPRRHDPGGHHQAEAADEQRRLQRARKVSARRTRRSTAS